MNLSSKKVISGECFTIELTFLDYVVDSFYTAMSGGDIDFVMTKNKLKIVLPNSYWCCSMCSFSVFKFTSFLKEVFQRHKELRNLGWCAHFYVHVVDEIVTFEFKNKAPKINDINNIFCISNCYYCNFFFIFKGNK